MKAWPGKGQGRVTSRPRSGTGTGEGLQSLQRPQVGIDTCPLLVGTFSSGCSFRTNVPDAVGF